MADHSRDRLTLARRFLEPSNSTHRQYEALRAFFVDGLPSAEAAARFGYTPGSFRVLVHQFRNRPERPRPAVADVADVRRLDLTPRTLRTSFGGLFLFLPWLVSADLDALLTRGGFPGSRMVPAASAVRSLLALKLFGNARHSHVMS